MNYMHWNFVSFEKKTLIYTLLFQNLYWFRNDLIFLLKKVHFFPEQILMDFNKKEGDSLLQPWEKKY